MPDAGFEMETRTYIRPSLLFIFLSAPLALPHTADGQDSAIQAFEDFATEVPGVHAPRFSR